MSDRPTNVAGSSKPSLRDHLLAALAPLANPTDLRLTVLSSSPKRTTALYPHAERAPKCWEREFLVVVSASLDSSVSGPSAPAPSVPDPSAISAPAPSARSAPSAPSGQSASISNSSSLDSSDATNPAPTSTPASHPSPPPNPSPLPRSVLVVALSAYLYTLPPSSPSATSPSTPSATPPATPPASPTSILYISKLDTSGHQPHRLPLTRAVIVAFATYFLQQATRPTPRVSMHLFARSQSQYLFPNSAGVAGKRLPGGLGLCGWWKGVYEDVAVVLERQQNPPHQHQQETAGEVKDVNKINNLNGGSHSRQRVEPDLIQLRYMLPSYDAAEAASLLGGKGGTRVSPTLEWAYAPPFLDHLVDTADSDPSSSSSSDHYRPQNGSGVGSGSTTSRGLATLVPSLPDDPKTRFLDELVTSSTSELDQQRARVGDSEDEPKADHGGRQKPERAADGNANVNGNPNGTDHGHGHGHSRGEGKRRRNAEEEMMERRRAQGILARVSPAEFWTRLGFRQECAQDPTGFFALSVQPLPSPPSPSPPSTSAAPPTTSASPSTSAPGTTSALAPSAPAPAPTSAPAPVPLPQTHAHESPSGRLESGFSPSPPLPPAIVERVRDALLNCDFATLDLATDATKFWSDSVRRIVIDEIGTQGYDACTATVPAKRGLATVGGGEKRKEEVVTVLQVRKKKKPA